MTCLQKLLFMYSSNLPVPNNVTSIQKNFQTYTARLVVINLQVIIWLENITYFIWQFISSIKQILCKFKEF